MLSTFYKFPYVFARNKQLFLATIRYFHFFPSGPKDGKMFFALLFIADRKEHFQQNKYLFLVHPTYAYFFITREAEVIAGGRLAEARRYST